MCRILFLGSSGVPYRCSWQVQEAGGPVRIQRSITAPYGDVWKNFGKPTFPVCTPVLPMTLLLYTQSYFPIDFEDWRREYGSSRAREVCCCRWYRTPIWILCLCDFAGLQSHFLVYNGFIFKGSLQASTMEVDEGHQRIDGCPVPCRSRYLQVLTMFQEMCDFPLGDLAKVVIWVGQMVFRFNMRESEWGDGASCELPEFWFSILILGPKLSQIKFFCYFLFLLTWFTVVGKTM